MNKLLFIVPPTLHMGERATKLRNQEATIPYGVLSMMTYMAAELKDVEYTADVIDLNVAPYSALHDADLYARLKKAAVGFGANIIGISAPYNHVYPYVEAIARELKSVLPESTLIVGGPCAMAYYAEMVTEIEAVDAVCFAEGEIPIVDLLRSQNIQKTLVDNPAFITQQSLLSGKKPKACFVDNLDDIPPVNFDFVDITKYGSHRESFRPGRSKSDIILPISTTRGCPYDCVFCVAKSLHGRKVRKMSPLRVAKDAKQLVDKYKINVLSIEDDQFLLDKKRAKEMLRELAKLQLVLLADSGFTVSLLDDEVARLLKEAGLVTATLAIESGSEYVLKEIINKPLNLHDVGKAVASLRKHGLFVHAFLVIGFPGEREKDRQATRDFIKKTGIDWCYITCATPIKGSRLYDICREKNYLNASYKGADAFYASSITTPDFTSEYMTREAYLMNLELNFVHNYRRKTGDIPVFTLYMEHVAGKYPSHAFAHYFLAECHQIMGNKAKYEEHYRLFTKITDEDPEWAEYARYFALA